MGIKYITTQKAAKDCFLVAVFNALRYQYSLSPRDCRIIPGSYTRFYNTYKWILTSEGFNSTNVHSFLHLMGLYHYKGRLQAKKPRIVLFKTGDINHYVFMPSAYEISGNTTKSITWIKNFKIQTWEIQL